MTTPPFFEVGRDSRLPAIRVLSIPSRRCVGGMDELTKSWGRSRWLATGAALRLSPWLSSLRSRRALENDIVIHSVYAFLPGESTCYLEALAPVSMCLFSASCRFPS